MTVTSGADVASTHQQREDNPWAINIVDHPKRLESPWFRDAKRIAKKILDTLDASTYPYRPQAVGRCHHGGSLWVLTDAGWRMYLARAPIEWSLQFCADP